MTVDRVWQLYGDRLIEISLSSSVEGRTPPELQGRGHRKHHRLQNYAASHHRGCEVSTLHLAVFSRSIDPQLVVLLRVEHRRDQVLTFEAQTRTTEMAGTTSIHELTIVDPAFTARFRIEFIQNMQEQTQGFHFLTSRARRRFPGLSNGTCEPRCKHSGKAADLTLPVR